jgi:hypothetical protein
MTSETGSPNGEPEKKSKIRRAWSYYRWIDRMRGWSDWYNWLSGFLQTKAGVAAAVGSAAAVTTATAVVVHTVMTEPPPPPPPIETAATEPRPPAEPVRETKSSVIFAIEGRDKAGRRGAFDVVVAQKEFLWVRKSSEEIEKSGAIVPSADIAGLVFDAYIKTGLEEAKEIIAVGTASQEGDAKEETERAGKRAERTAEIVASVVDAEIPIWTLNLGQYREPSQGAATDGTNWQRPFMVIAVKELEPETNLGEALADAMTGQSKLPSPKAYSAFDLAMFR